MKLSDRELAFIIESLTGGASIRPGTNAFTGQESLALITKLKAEHKARQCQIPPDWREKAQAYLDAGRPVTEFAPSAELRAIERRKAKIESQRIAALSANDALAELGL